MTRITHLSYAFLILVLSLFVLPCAQAAVTWTQQPGEYNWYKSGTANKYEVTNPVDFTIPKSYVKQNDKIYIHCKSSGGASRYYEQGLDCYGKPKTTVLAPPKDAVSCAEEGKACAIPNAQTATVWYGAADKWTAKEKVTNTIQCSNEAFGKDPAFGHNKKCLYKISSTTNPVPPVVIVPNKCEAFICEDDNGIVFDLSVNTVLTCPRVYVTKEQVAMIYDATKVNNIPPCK